MKNAMPAKLNKTETLYNRFCAEAIKVLEEFILFTVREEAIVAIKSKISRRRIPNPRPSVALLKVPVK